MKEGEFDYKGYVQVVIVLDSEEIIALQQSNVIVVDLWRPPVLLQEDHVLQNDDDLCRRNGANALHRPRREASLVPSRDG